MSRSGSDYRNPHHHGRRRVEDDSPIKRIHGFRPLPSGVPCPDCGADWQPICPTKGCPGNAALHELPDTLAATIRRERRGRPHSKPDR